MLSIIDNFFTKSIDFIFYKSGNFFNNKICQKINLFFEKQKNLVINRN